MRPTVRVGIADDDEIIRVTLSHALSKSPHLKVIAAVEDGEAAVRLALSGHIDVLVLDMDMPRMSGPEALRHIRDQAPAVKVIMHSSRAASKAAMDMKKAGATAYVEKASGPASVVQAILEAAQAASFSRSS